MKQIDAKNLQCPMPIVKIARSLKDQEAGSQFLIEATDLAFEADIRAWCEQTGNSLDHFENKNGIFYASITKSNSTC